MVKKQVSAHFLQPKGKIKPWPSGVNYLDPMSLTYTNVNLVPRLSDIKTRKNIDTSVKFGPFKLKIPILSGPMDTVTGEKMARTLHKLGGLAVMPRATFNQKSKNVKLCQKLSGDKVNAIWSIGFKDTEDYILKLKAVGAKMILIDIAHGGIQTAIQKAMKVKKMGVEVLMGNIANYEQAKFYKRHDLKYVRVGVGPGGLCTTRLVAGTGVGQLSAVLDVSATGVDVVADGGIRHPGDVAKAIAAGAKVVMIGSLLTGTDEAPGKIINNTKVARGQASNTYMKDNHVKINEFRAPEGIQTTVKLKGPAENTIHFLVGGLRSAMSYAGAKNLDEFHQKALFVLASEAVQKENLPHINL